MITPERVCKVLEGLCLLDLDSTHENRKTFVDRAYRWCHIARNGCKNPHKDWENEFLEVEKEVWEALKSPAEKSKEKMTKFKDLSVGDMFNTKAARYVKTIDDKAIVVMSGVRKVGDIYDVDEDMEIIPLYQSKVD